MYILQCCDGRFYVGSTHSLELRISQHRNGVGANFTRKRLPVTLVHFEYFTTIKEAFEREHQVKKWSRKKKRALVEERDLDLIQFAKKDFDKER